MKKSKQNISINSLGSSRVYAHQKRTRNLNIYFGFRGKERNEKVQKVKDYIFGKSEESGLEAIAKEFDTDCKSIEKRIEKIVNGSEKC